MEPKIIKCRLALPSDKTPPPLGIGDRIWRRPGALPSTGLSAVRFDPSLRGLVRVCRAQKNENDVWVVASSAQKLGGLVTFVAGSLPDDWTFLEVFAVAESGTAVFAAPVSGDPAELAAVHGIGPFAVKTIPVPFGICHVVPERSVEKTVAALEALAKYRRDQTFKLPGWTWPIFDALGLTPALRPAVPRVKMPKERRKGELEFETPAVVVGFVNLA